jgi:hypothetical protein
MFVETIFINQTRAGTMARFWFVHGEVLGSILNQHFIFNISVFHARGFSSHPHPFLLKLCFWQNQALGLGLVYCYSHPFAYCLHPFLFDFIFIC